MNHTNVFTEVCSSLLNVTYVQKSCCLTWKSRHLHTRRNNRNFFNMPMSQDRRVNKMLCSSAYVDQLLYTDLR